MGKSSSRKLRRVIYYTLYRMDPQKTHSKIVFALTYQKSKNQKNKSLNSAPGPPALPGVGGMGGALSITKKHMDIIPRTSLANTMGGTNLVHKRLGGTVAGMAVGIG